MSSRILWHPVLNPLMKLLFDAHWCLTLVIDLVAPLAQSSLTVTAVNAKIRFDSTRFNMFNVRGATDKEISSVNSENAEYELIQCRSAIQTAKNSWALVFLIGHVSPQDESSAYRPVDRSLDVSDVRDNKCVS